MEATGPPPDSHVVVTVSGLEDADAISALGVYLTALVANVVAIDLSLADRLLGAGADAEEQLRSDVHELIGDSNAISSSFREDQRNPWIAEGIAHLLVALPVEGPGPCVPGMVHALTLPHEKSSQQGLDTVAIYDAEDMLLAVCIGEAKASERLAGVHLGRSVKLFRSIDAGSREHSIRSTINMLSAYLRADVRDRVVPSFWKEQRMYMPVIGYKSDCGFQPTQNRPATLGSLAVPSTNRRLVTLSLQNFHQFFDDVADAMHAAIVI